MSKNIKDKNFGDIFWNLDECYWYFNLTIDDRQCSVTILQDEDESDKAIIRGRMRQTLLWIRENYLTLKQKVAQELFDCWQDTWFDEEYDNEHTLNSFANLLKIDGINYDEDDVPLIYFSDFGLFGGHWIEFSIDENGQFIYSPELVG